MTREELDELLSKSLDIMADRFTNDTPIEVSEKDLVEWLALSDSRFAWRLFDRLKAIRAIEEREHLRQSFSPSSRPITHGTYWIISPLIFEVRDEYHQSRDLRRRPVDRVDAASAWARAHPVLSVVVIALVAMTFLATLLNQAIELLTKLGLLDAQ